MGKLSCIIQEDPKCKHKCPYKGETERDSTCRREDHVTMEAETEVVWPQPRSAGSHQKLEAAGNGVFPEPPGEWLC